MRNLTYSLGPSLIRHKPEEKYRFYLQCEYPVTYESYVRTRQDGRIVDSPLPAYMRFEPTSLTWSIYNEDVSYAGSTLEVVVKASIADAPYKADGKNTTDESLSWFLTFFLYTGPALNLPPVLYRSLQPMRLNLGDVERLTL